MFGGKCWNDTSGELKPKFGSLNAHKHTRNTLYFPTLLFFASGHSATTVTTTLMRIMMMMMMILILYRKGSPLLSECHKWIRLTTQSRFTFLYSMGPCAKLHTHDHEWQRSCGCKCVGAVDNITVHSGCFAFIHCFPCKRSTTCWHLYLVSDDELHIITMVKRQCHLNYSNVFTISIILHWITPALSKSTPQRTTMWYAMCGIAKWIAIIPTIP